MKADFSKIIIESIQITKTNRKLWVLGLVVATLGAGANVSSGGNFSDAFKEVEKQKRENSVEYTSPYDFENLNEYKDSTNNYINSNLVASASFLPQVLGSTTNGLIELLKTIPLSFYGALGALLIASIVLGMAVSFYGQAWSTSGLIQGINNQHAGETSSLYQMSDKGKLTAVEVVKIRLLPSLLFALALLMGGLIIAILAILLGDVGKVLAIILGILYVFAAIIATIVIGASIHLGVLAINLETLNWRAGFKKGFTVFKTYFFDVLIMSFINCFAGCVFGLAGLFMLAVLGGIGVAAVFGVIAFPPFLVAAAPIIFLVILALIIAMGILGAISAVFKQSTWVLLYKQLTEETHGTS